MSGSKKDAIRGVVKGAGIVYVGLVLEMAIAFIAQWLAARYLSTDGFGSLQIGITLVNLCAILATYGLADGFTRYLPRLQVEDRRSVSVTAFLLVVPTATVMGLLLFISAIPLARFLGDVNVATSIRVFGLVIPFAATLRLALGGIRGQKYSRYRVYIENFIRPITRFTFVCAAVYWGLGELGLAVAYALPYTFASVIGIWFFRRTLPGVFRDRTVNIPKTKEILRYSLPFTVSKVASFVYRSADVFLVLYFIGSSGVAVYSIAYTVGTLMLMISTAFNYLGAPISSELEAVGDVHDVLGVQEVMLRWLVVGSIVLLVPFTIYPETILVSIYDARYATGALPLAILAITFAIHNVFSPFANVLQALGKSRPLAINAIISGILNIALNLILIPAFGAGLGIIGAAIATLVAYLVLDLLMIVEVWYYTGTVGLTETSITPTILGSGLLGITWVVSELLSPSIYLIVISIILFGIVYILTVIRLSGFEEAEIMLIHDIDHKYGTNLKSIIRLLDRAR